jgi:Kef-type K+ transport system membrane component KefB
MFVPIGTPDEGMRDTMAATAAPPADNERVGMSPSRLALGYGLVIAFMIVAIGVSISIGNDREHATPIAGIYDVEAAGCLAGPIELTQSGEFVGLDGSGSTGGKLRLEGERLTGDVTCADGTTGAAALTVAGSGETARLSGTIGTQSVTGAFAEELPEAGTSAQPAKKRSGEETFGRLMLAIAAVILAARVMGLALGKIGQPQVMGEVLAGILLGPTLLGAIAPEVKDYLFPGDIVPLITGAADIGLAFYLFLVGLELDPKLVRERLGQAALISNTSVAFPMALGFLAAIPIYTILAPDADYLPFALFIGVSMSVTAFPVLARILIERRMLKHPVGALSMAGAAIDDVTAWGLLALATAVAGTGSGIDALVIMGWAGVFTAAMLTIGRRFLGRLATAYDEVGRIPALWLGVIFVGVLLSAFVAQQIGIAAIFGAFVMGLIMPRKAGLTEDVTHRIEDFVTFVLLPLFFVVTGLRTEIGSIDRPELWLITLGLIGVAVAGKWLGAMAAARYGGFGWRESAAVGALMNTRGLTELIVLNIGLELGLISTTLFTMLVVMALVTTFMAGPALRLLDPHGRLSAPPEEALRNALREVAPTDSLVDARHSIIVAPQDPRNMDALVSIAEPLASSQPPRDLILASLIVPQRTATGLASEDREIRRATEELQRRREVLLGRNVTARAIAFTTPDAGEDLVRLARDERIDILLLDGRRPLLGDGIPKGEVGRVLSDADADVAVLVERQRGPVEIDADHPVYVPFGGAEHDWAALELGAWIAHARRAPLRLMGASFDVQQGTRDSSPLLANASLVIQQLTGIVPEPVLVNPGPDVIRKAADAGLLVVGLSDRWRDEGLGELRSEIVKSAPAPVLLVRRGTRAGALAGRDDVTRFRWSSAGQGPGVGGGSAVSNRRESGPETPLETM